MESDFAYELNKIVALKLNGYTGNVRGVVTKREKCYTLDAEDGYVHTSAREAAAFLAGEKDFSEVKEI
jgi:archaeosine-15-forming tRNA-guanine transglycosylase